MKKLILTTILTLAVSYTVYADDKDRVIDSLTTVIEDLRTKIEYLRTKIKDLRTENMNLMGEIYSLKSNNEGLPFGTKKFSSPIPFENSKTARFKVFQALNGYALARAKDGWESYYGPIVVLVGTYYDDLIVKIKNPMIVGRYTYTTKENRERTVPVIQPLEEITNKK